MNYWHKPQTIFTGDLRPSSTCKPVAQIMVHIDPRYWHADDPPLVGVFVIKQMDQTTVQPGRYVMDLGGTGWWVNVTEVNLSAASASPCGFGSLELLQEDSERWWRLHAA